MVNGVWDAILEVLFMAQSYRLGRSREQTGAGASMRPIATPRHPALVPMHPRPPHIVILPALGVAGSYYRPLQAALQERLGATTSVVEPPGPGGWSARLLAQVRHGYPELVQDITREVQAQRGADAGRPVLLLGHSLGGHAALVAATRLPAEVAGIALVACGTPWWGAWPAAQQGRLRRMIRTVGLASALLPWYPGHLLGFGGDQPRRLMRDWSVLAHSGRLARIPGLAADAPGFARLDLPLLSVNLAGDDYAPVSATEHLLAEFPALRRSAVTLDDEALRGLPGARRHVAWIRKPRSVVEQVAGWWAALPGA